MIFSRKTLNILSSKFTKLVAAVIIITCTQFTGKLNAAIPEYKGLYTIFTPENSAKLAVDTIGMGQAFLYTGWLEKVYTYAPENNPARKVIAILWFKNIIDKEGNFNKNANFHMSQNYPVKGLNAKDIGKIIKYLREFNPYNLDDKKLEDENRATFVRKLRKVLRSGTSKQALINLLKALEELKYHPDFFQETAEAILWAFFERKFDGQKDFIDCLNEIDPKLTNKLLEIYTKEDFNAIKTKFENNNFIEFENTIKTILSDETNKFSMSDKDKDELIYYTIKSSKKGSAPRSVELANIPYKDPKTGIKTPEIATCFESAVLEFISLLIYDPEKQEYDPKILPENITKGPEFNKMLKNIFYTNKNLTKEKEIEFIDSEKINLKIQNWIDMVTNLPDLKYGKYLQHEYKENKPTVYFDLRATIENFIKCINKFMDLGLTIQDTEEFFIVTEANGQQLKIKKDYVPQDITTQSNNACDNLWQTLLDKIAKMLSTEKRPVNLTVRYTKTKKQDMEGYYDTKDIDGSIGETSFTIQLLGAHGDIRLNNINSNKTMQIILHNTLCNIKEYPESFCREFAPLLLTKTPEIKINQNLKIFPKIFNLSFYALNLLLKNKDTTDSIFHQLLYNFDPKIIKLINGHETIKSSILHLISTKELNSKSFLNKLIDLKKKYPEESFWDKDIYAYVKKSITNNNAKKESDDYVLRHCVNILSFADKLSQEINPNKWLQEIILGIIDQPRDESYYDAIDLLIEYYSACKSKSNNANDKIYWEKIKQKIVNTIEKAKTEEKKFKICERIIRENTNKEGNFKNKSLKNLFIKNITTIGNLNKLLITISHRNNLEALEIISKHKKINPNYEQDESTLLGASIQSDNTIMTKKLLSYKNIDVNKLHTLYVEKAPPIYFAIKKRNIEAVKMLLENKKLDINLPSSDKYNGYKTPIYIAIENFWQESRGRKKIEILKAILSHKNINVNSKCGNNNQTPLHFILEIINHNNLDLNKDGTKINKEALTMLLNHPDIKVNLQDKDGKTPLDIAESFKKRDEEIISLLKEKSKKEKIDEIKNSWPFVKKTIDFLLTVNYYLGAKHEIN